MNNNNFFIENYYERFSDCLTSQTIPEKALDDLLRISNIDIRLFNSNNHEDYQALLTVLLLYIQKGHLDNEFFKNPTDNRFKVETILVRLSQYTYYLKYIFKLDDISDQTDDELQHNSRDAYSRQEDGYKETIENTINLIKWLQFKLKPYAPELILEIELTDEEIFAGADKEDRRRTQKNTPTNDVKLFALHTLFDESLKTTHNLNKQDKMRIIHLITGVNKNDGYQGVYTSRKVKLSKNNQPLIEEIEELKRKIEESKIEIEKLKK